MDESPDKIVASLSQNLSQLLTADNNSQNAKSQDSNNNSQEPRGSNNVNTDDEKKKFKETCRSKAIIDGKFFQVDFKNSNFKSINAKCLTCKKTYHLSSFQSISNYSYYLKVSIS